MFCVFFIGSNVLRRYKESRGRIFRSWKNVFWFCVSCFILCNDIVAYCPLQLPEDVDTVYYEGTCYYSPPFETPEGRKGQTVFLMLIKWLYMEHMAVNHWHNNNQWFHLLVNLCHGFLTLSTHRQFTLNWYSNFFKCSYVWVFVCADYFDLSCCCDCKNRRAGKWIEPWFCPIINITLHLLWLNDCISSCMFGFRHQVLDLPVPFITSCPISAETLNKS